ncbi:MAG TPA: hypothetical protein VGG72_28765 [Bryobacteraceae bacterium]|jgi:hypothetical protein
MTDENLGDEKRRLPKRRHGRKKLTDADLKELFGELAEPLPSEQLTKKTRDTIRALTAVADMENAYDAEKVKELEKMVGLKDDEKTKSFTDKEDSRRKPPGFTRGE